MKYRELVQALKRAGWRLLRQGTRHEVWTNGERVTTVPRHKEINEYTAQGILRKAGIKK